MSGRHNGVKRAPHRAEGAPHRPKRALVRPSPDHIAVFGATGQYQRSIGREGAGPGEFRSIDGVAVDATGTRIYARDPLLNRVSVFDTAGVHQQSFTLTRPFAQISQRTSLWVDLDGRIHDLTQMGSTMSVDSVGVVSYDPNHDVLGSTLVAATEPRRLLLRSVAGQPRSAAIVPFAAFTRAAVSPDGRVYGGTGEQYRIGVFQDGRLVREILRPSPAREVPDWAADTVDAIAARMRRNEPDGVVEQDELPEHQPFYNFLLVDAAGYLWVAQEGLDHTPAARYEIFNPDGSYHGVFELPPMLIDQVGVDYIVGRRLDELGVERIVILPLSRME